VTSIPDGPLKILKMSLLKVFFVSAIVAAVTVNGNKVSYAGYKVYHVTPNTQNDVEYLRGLESQGVGYKLIRLLCIKKSIIFQYFQ